MATPSQIATGIKNILKDYNYWPSSESDSPLAVKRAKGLLDEKKILSIDASIRRKIARDNGVEGYKIPVPEARAIASNGLRETFDPLVGNAIQNVINTQGQPIEAFLMPAESLEFAVQLFDGFKDLGNPRVVEVSLAGEAHVTLLIIGEVGDPAAPETIYAVSNLVRT